MISIRSLKNLSEERTKIWQKYTWGQSCYHIYQEISKIKGWYWGGLWTSYIVEGQLGRSIWYTSVNLEFID